MRKFWTKNALDAALVWLGAVAAKTARWTGTVGLLALGSGAPLTLWAQPSAIRTATNPAFGQRLRVLPTRAGGWTLFGRDSLTVSIFAPCGRHTATRRYGLPTALAPMPGTADAVAVTGDGVAFMTRRRVGNHGGVAVVCLNAAGAVRWSRTYADDGHEFYPYTLAQEANGDFLLYGNTERLTDNASFSFVSRLDSAGRQRWTKLYTLGNIWGELLVTTDGGFLFRSGNRFTKTDRDGDLVWSANVPLNGDYGYPVPVEVAAGYVFTSRSTVTQQISFYQIDRQGRAVGGGQKRTFSYTGALPVLAQTRNGPLVGIFGGALGGPPPTIVTFDGNLNVVGQRASAIPGQRLTGLGGCLLNGGGAVVVGQTNTPDTYFMARTDAQFGTACDTALPAPTVTTTAALATPWGPSALPFQFTEAAITVVDQVLAVSQTTLCGPPLGLWLGPDTVVCTGTPLTLGNRLPGAFETYRWSTGATTARLPVAQAGRYWVQATANCGLDTRTDTLTVTIMPTAPAPAPPADTVLCLNTTVTLDARVPAPGGSLLRYEWADGPTTAGRVVADTGTYLVTIRAPGACLRQVRYHVSECERLLMPNVITPNGDGQNERLVPTVMRGFREASLAIYSRWGQLLFTTPDLRLTGWDGTAAAAGTYFWLVHATTRRGYSYHAKGWVTVVR